MTQFTVGCDPEFFIKVLARKEPPPQKTRAEAQKSIDYYSKLMGATTAAAQEDAPKSEEVVPICGLLGGTKEHPMKIPEVGEGYAVQEDGVAAEFNIPPCSTAYDFGNSLSNMLSHIERAILLPKGLGRSYVNNLTLKKEWIEKHPNVGVIGCDPDYCAYDEKDGLPISRTLNPDLIAGVRGAGGHIHLGYPVDMCRPEILTKLLDVVVGLHFLHLDKQGARRQWWGLAGLYRPKSYGVEYRTMSNWWIWNASKAKTVAGCCLALLESLAGHMVEWSAAYNAIDWQQVKRVIDTEDSAQATNLFHRYCGMFPVLENVKRIGYEKAVWSPPVLVEAGQQARIRIPVPRFANMQMPQEAVRPAAEWREPDPE